MEKLRTSSLKIKSKYYDTEANNVSNSPFVVA